MPPGCLKSPIYDSKSYLTDCRLYFQSNQSLLSLITRIARWPPLRNVTGPGNVDIHWAVTHLAKLSAKVGGQWAAKRLNRFLVAE